MTLLQSAKRRSVAIYLLIAILAAAGLYQAGQLPSSIFPSVTFPVVKVIAEVGEEPAARMMPSVTRPLEEAMLRVPGINLVRSTTARGSSELTGQFTWGTDMQVALQRVQAETQRVLPNLPAGTKLDVEWMNPAVFPIQGYALISETQTPAQLRELAEFTLKPALIRIPGVSQVEVQGGLRREFRVELNRAALEARQLAASDVITAIKKSNQILSAGLVEQNHELYLALVNGRVGDIESLSRITVPIPDGLPARLSDLGTVRVADEISYIRTTANGHPAVLLNIIRQPSANTVAIANGIKELLQRQTDLIPKDVQWLTFYDQARFVSDSLRGTRDAILIGIALAAVVVLVFLRSWTQMLIAVANIPVAVAIVALALAVSGQTINLMTLAGIAAALGLIADDAIVVIENIHRHRELGTENPAQSGVREILPALIGSSLSTTVILLPFAVLTGIAGAFFKPLAVTMALSLVVSFILALISVPVAVELFSGKGRPRPEWRERLRQGWLRHGGLGVARLRAGIAGPFSNGYRGVTRFFVQHAAPPLVLLVAMIGAAYFLYQRIATDFLPSMDEGSIVLDYWTPPGTSLTDTHQMLNQAEKVIMAIPDVENYSRRTGTQLGFFITEPNRGDYVIKLKPRKQRRPIDEVIDDLRKRIAAVEPAIRTDFGQLLEDEIGDLTGGAPQPIDVKVFGPESATVEATAKRVASVLSSVPGVEDVFNGIVIAGPALDLRVDPVMAARYQMTAEDIHSEVEPAILGTVVDQLRVGERLYDLRVFAKSTRPLEEVRLRTPSGALLPLRDVASIITGKPEAEIHRENLKTFVGATARLSGGRSLGEAMNDIRPKIAEKVPLPPGMSIEYGGLYEQQQASFRGLLYVLLASLVLVSVVVLFEFADWRAPIVTAAAAIAALSGVFAALTLSGMTLNISSYVGAIMMVGIVGENAIFVIHDARLELRRGLSPYDAWTAASRRRLRPVAMTILATAFALGPLALAIGEGSQLMQPLAIGVIGGFVLSGPVVLWVVPGLYCWLDPRGRLGTPADYSATP